MTQSCQPGNFVLSNFLQWMTLRLLKICSILPHIRNFMSPIFWNHFERRYIVCSNQFVWTGSIIFFWRCCKLKQKRLKEVTQGNVSYRISWNGWHWDCWRYVPFRHISEMPLFLARWQLNLGKRLTLTGCLSVSKCTLRCETNSLYIKADNVPPHLLYYPKIRRYCILLTLLAIYECQNKTFHIIKHSTKKRASHTSALRADGVQLRVDF